jgi:hypothetical protein
MSTQHATSGHRSPFPVIGLKIVIALAASACSYDWSMYSSSLAGGGDASTGSHGAGDTTSTATSPSATGGAGGAGTTGSGGAGGSGGVVPCSPGGFDALQETFSGSAVDAAKWHSGVSGDALITVSDGQLALRLPQDSGASWAGIDSMNPYDLIDCQVSIRVLEAPNPDTEAVAHFTVEVDGSNYIAFEHWGTDLMATCFIEDEFFSLQTVRYDPVAHAYWRLREAAGVSYWETSADGVAWTLLVSRPNPIPVRGLFMILGAGTSRREAIPPGAFRIDDVNVVP